jgi:putative colanic acid biosysnthesis UDP-glucose lipid carrier transferase
MQLVLDSIVLLAIGFGLYYYLVFYSYRSADFYSFAITFNWLLTVMLLFFAGLYQFEALINFSQTIDRILIAVVTAAIFMIAVAFAVKISTVFSRTWVIAFIAGNLIGLLASRASMSWFLGRLGRRRIVGRNVAIYGVGTQIVQLLAHLKKSEPSFVNVIGIYSDEKTLTQGAAGLPKISGGMDELVSFVRNGEVDDIVLAMPWADDGQAAAVIQKLRELPTYVYLSVDLIGYKVSLQQPPSYYQKQPFYQVVGKPLTGWDVVLKSLEDFVLGSMLLILLAPFLLIVFLVIKIDSPGPVIFKQKRLGFNNQPFDIFKFRTMVINQEQFGKTLQATKQDPRVTRIGRFLRRTSIDELPQLLNVLNGTMSLVGPRPHAIDHNEDYSEKIRGYFSRHRVKPGITGLAQIKGFRGLTDTIDKMEGRVKYDIEYVDTWSLLLDFRILVMTLFTAIGGRNAF